MFDNQVVPKSRGPAPESSGKFTGVQSRSSDIENSGKIYLDSTQAIADFDAEATAFGPQEENQISGALRTYIFNAKVLMKHREYSLALNILRQASNKDSKNPTTLALLAECLEKTSRLDEALIVRRALAKVDYNFESLFGFATALYKIGRDQEALDKYYEALSVLTVENSHLFELYKNMGNIFVRQGDFDGAEEYYNKAYTVNPLSDVLLVNLGTLEVQRQDYDKSLYCFRKAVELNAENDKAWVGLAMVHSHFADHELAWANIEMAAEINSRNRTAVHLIANWGLRDGKILKAIEALQTFLGSVEHDEDMSLVLINLFCSSGQYDKALLEVERVLLWNPDHAEVREIKKKLNATQQVKAA